MIVGAGAGAGLDEYLLPMPFTGEALRFDLAAYRSTVTRQMLQFRLRFTARAFGVGSGLVAANLAEDGSVLEVDTAGLAAADDEVRSRLEAGPEGAVGYLRALFAARASLDRVAGGFGGRLSRSVRPGRRSFVAYVEASARDQALGALKFCLPGTLRPTLRGLLGGDALVDALLAPEEPTLWSVVSRSELALARLRVRGPAAHAHYHRRLDRHRRAYGYLYAEDVDFRTHESLDAIDARVASLDDGVTERHWLADALASDRAAKIRARNVFADRLASDGVGGVSTLVSHVLLARALAAHEDLNRRGKMRLLRDLRDLADLTGLDLEEASLVDFAAASDGTVAVRSAARSR